MALGEYRVGIDFNPSGDALVAEIKRRAADLIDLLAGHRAEGSKDSEILRLWAEAMTCIETGAMYGVKAATKKPL